MGLFSSVKKFAKKVFKEFVHDPIAAAGDALEGGQPVPTGPNPAAPPPAVVVTPPPSPTITPPTPPPAPVTPPPAPTAEKVAEKGSYEEEPAVKRIKKARGFLATIRTSQRGLLNEPDTITRTLSAVR